MRVGGSLRGSRRCVKQRRRAMLGADEGGREATEKLPGDCFLRLVETSDLDNFTLLIHFHGDRRPFFHGGK
jgi:hypothetical protein